MTTTRASSTVLALLILAACGGDQQSTSPEREIPVAEVVQPQFRRALATADGILLSPRDIVGGDNSLLILDESSDEIWELSLQASHELRRVSRPRQFGQSGVFALTNHSAGLSLLGVDGSLRLMKRAESDQLVRALRVFAPMHRPMALGEGMEGGWIAVHAVVVLQGVAPVDSVIVSNVDSMGRVTRRFGFERSGPNRKGMFIVDHVSAHAFGGRVIIAGADPARVIVVSATEVVEDTLVGVPMRDLNDDERAGLRRIQSDSRTPVLMRDARTPTQRPAVMAALPFDGGYLVVAQGGEAEQFLDLYCGRTYRRTVVSRPLLENIFVTEHGLAAIDEPSELTPDAPVTLSYYRAKDFITECTK